MPTNSKEYYEKNKKKYWNNKKAYKKRAMRNTARNRMIAAGKAKRGDGKQVDHKKALDNGGTNNPKNLRVISAKKNGQAGAKIANNKKGKGYKKAKTIKNNKK